MKTIKLDEQWEIRRDANSWNLINLIPAEKKKTGEKYFREEATYHATLGGALMWYVNMAMEPVDNAKEMKKQLDAFEEKILHAVKKVVV